MRFTNTAVISKILRQITLFFQLDFLFICNGNLNRCFIAIYVSSYLVISYIYILAFILHFCLLQHFNCHVCYPDDPVCVDFLYKIYNFYIISKYI